MYALWLGLISLANALGPEQWTAATFNMYVPQWLWALPALALLVVCLRKARRLWWLSLPLLLWVAGPLMGFNIPRGKSPARGAHSLRVMTYNVKYQRHDVGAILDDILLNRPDVLCIQDAKGPMLVPLLKTTLHGYQVWQGGQFIIASRYAFTAEERGYASVPRQTYARAEVQTPGGPVVVYDVHLRSPRYALTFRTQPGTEPQDLPANAEQRLTQADDLAAAVRAERLPMLLMGDLNSPVQSLVCRKLFAAGLRDAWNEAGWGYGYTYGQYLKPFYQPFVRIDHVMVGPAWGVGECWVAGRRGSEHRAISALMQLPTHPRGQRVFRGHVTRSHRRAPWDCSLAPHRMWPSLSEFRGECYLAYDEGTPELKAHLCRRALSHRIQRTLALPRPRACPDISTRC